jgi:ParB family chromosome partitioning protein
MARAGVFVMLGHDGAARIERGFVRAEDEQEEEPQDTENGAGEYEGEQYGESVAEEGGTPEVTQEEPEEEAGDAGKPISDSLLRDLTAHRTLGLRIALGEQPDIALLALTHTLAAQIFYHDSEASPLDLRAMIPPLGNHASGIEDTAVARVLADRHARWCARLPRESAGLWQSLTGMEMGERLELLAHCAALTVSAVRLPWDRRPRAHATTERIATALMLDMANHWTATVDSYFGRVTKAHILAAVAEAVDDEAAERLAGMKKQPMAEAAQDLLAGTFWLPAALRTAELDLFNAEEAAPMAASIAAE